MNDKLAQRLVVAVEVLAHRIWWVALWLFVLLLK